MADSATRKPACGVSHPARARRTHSQAATCSRRASSTAVWRCLFPQASLLRVVGHGRRVASEVGCLVGSDCRGTDGVVSPRSSEHPATASSTPGTLGTPSAGTCWSGVRHSISTSHTPWPPQRPCCSISASTAGVATLHRPLHRRPQDAAGRHHAWSCLAATPSAAGLFLSAPSPVSCLYFFDLFVVSRGRRLPVPPWALPAPGHAPLGCVRWPGRDTEGESERERERDRAIPRGSIQKRPQNHLYKISFHVFSKLSTTTLSTR